MWCDLAVWGVLWVLLGVFEVDLYLCIFLWIKHILQRRIFQSPAWMDKTDCQGLGRISGKCWGWGGASYIQYIILSSNRAWDPIVFRISILPFLKEKLPVLGRGGAVTFYVELGRDLGSHSFLNFEVIAWASVIEASPSIST